MPPSNSDTVIGYKAHLIPLDSPVTDNGQQARLETASGHWQASCEPRPPGSRQRSKGDLPQNFYKVEIPHPCSRRLWSKDPGVVRLTVPLTILLGFCSFFFFFTKVLAHWKLEQNNKTRFLTTETELL